MILDSELGMNEDLYMPEKRRQFSAQFKAEAVHMVVGLGRSLTAFAGPGDQSGHTR